MWIQSSRASSAPDVRADSKTRPGGAAWAGAIVSQIIESAAYPDPPDRDEARQASALGFDLGAGHRHELIHLGVDLGGGDRDPRSGHTVRYHLLHDQVQRAVRQAALRLNLDGIVTPHALRHAYATHSKESIETLRKLMGHVSIETTAGYRHPDVDSASNPLDDLLVPAPTPTLP